MRGLLVLFTIGLIGFFFFSSDLNFFKSDKSPRVGFVKTSKGMLMGKTSQDEYYKNLEAGSPLPSPVRLITGFNSEALVFFGEEFKVAASSSLELLKRAGRFEVRVLSGEVERKAVSPVVDFYSGNTKTNELKISTAESASLTKIDNLDVQSTPQNSLTQFDPDLQNRLQDTFKLHQRFIEKCFIKHYERALGQTQSGQVVVQFKIVQKGHIENIKVVGSDYKDEDFHKCLKEVVSRVQLKFFDSQPMVVNFPIRLQLPR